MLPRILSFDRPAARFTELVRTLRVEHQFHHGVCKVLCIVSDQYVDPILCANAAETLRSCHDRARHGPRLQDLVLDSRAQAHRAGKDRRSGQIGSHILNRSSHLDLLRRKGTDRICRVPSNQAYPCFRNASPNARKYFLHK